MKSRKRPQPIVFDLEFTAWEGSMARHWSEPGELKEVVQFGAVKLDGETPKIIDEFQMLVRPRVNPVLSDYLVSLTGITNAALQKEGVDFVTAFRVFCDFSGEGPIWAFGRDDLILAENLKLYGMADAMPIPLYQNVIPWFAGLGVDLSGKHACHVASAAGVDYDGREHDALADARSVALGMIAMVNKGAANPFVKAAP
jgi:hypothetical protein